MRCLLPALLALAGCSSVSVLHERETASLAPTVRPEVFYVRPFVVQLGSEFDVAAATPGEDVAAKLGSIVARGILSRAPELVAPGRLLDSAAPAPSEGLLVQGKILRVRQGSRALRMAVGFGAGRTRLETSVRVFNLSASATEPWLAFETTGGSNMEPGVVGALVPSPVSIPIAISVVGGAVTAGAIGAKGVTQDAERTGRVITAAVHDKLAKRKLVERVTMAKRAGRLATPVGEVPVPAVE
ncbi:MAG: DUF4410 domain-containing protein [Chthoniobacterales bacterium]|jgi:hypothetical protein